MYARTYLNQHHAEPVPAWLQSHVPCSPLDVGAFFASRVVYYPGCGNDGHAIKLFGGSHAAHCFVYADYLRSRDDVAGEFEHPATGLRGYEPITRSDMDPTLLAPGWRPLRIWTWSHPSCPAPLDHMPTEAQLQARAAWRPIPADHASLSGGQPSYFSGYL